MKLYVVYVDSFLHSLRFGPASSFESSFSIGWHYIIGTTLTVVLTKSSEDAVEKKSPIWPGISLHSAPVPPPRNLQKSLPKIPAPESRYKVQVLQSIVPVWKARSYTKNVVWPVPKDLLVPAPICCRQGGGDSAKPAKPIGGRQPKSSKVRDVLVNVYFIYTSIWSIL